jgi:hypothetical protein
VTEKTCGTCVFFGFGACYRYPPVVQWAEWEDRNEKQSDWAQSRPVVEADTKACGEHKDQ